MKLKKILLAYAGEESKRPRFPLSCLALASYLRKEGYDAEIRDLRLNSSFKDIDVEQYSCLCVSSMTGPDLKSAKAISQFFKSNDPAIPVIWGGHHASAAPEQTIRERYIDTIIVGEGEKALITALKDLQEGKLKEIYHQDQIDMEELDIPAYDLIEVEKYLDNKDGWSYEPSRGCPHRCRFCYVYYFHDRKWRSKSADKVVEEIKYLVKHYNMKKLKIIGDNFFVNKNFALEICRRITPLKLSWSSTIRIDYICRYTDEELKIIKDSGCWMLQMGAESGSQEILEYIQKDITAEQSKIAIKKCADQGILPLVSLIIGLPGEKKEQVLETLNLYDELTELGGEMNGVFIYRPYPGTPLYADAINFGYKSPRNVDEWSSVKLRRTRLPWHGKMGAELETITGISRFNFFVSHLKNFSDENVKNKLGFSRTAVNLAIAPFKLSSKLRWKHRYFKMGIEWKLFFKVLSWFTDLY